MQSLKTPPESGTAASLRSPVGWTVLAALALSALAALGALWWFEQRRAAEARPSPKELQLKLNINRATARELGLVPSIGTRRAMKIINARQKRGGFKRLTEIDEPDVLGPGAAERLAPYFLPLPEESGP